MSPIDTRHALIQVIKYCRSPYASPAWICAGDVDTRPQVQMMVHLDLLRRKAPGLIRRDTFQRTENDEWPSVLLPCDDAKAIPLFVVWLYTGALVPRSTTADASKSADADRLVVGTPREPSEHRLSGYAVSENELADARAWDDADLVAVHVFARKYQVPGLEEYSLAMLLKVNERCNWSISKRATALAYTALPSDAQMNRYITQSTFDLILCDGEDEGRWRLPDTDGWPARYVGDLLRESLGHVDQERYDYAYDNTKYDYLEAWDSRHERRKLARRRKADGTCVDLVQVRDIGVRQEMKRLTISRSMFKETATVIVGAAKTPFVLHKGLACHYSDFFREAFQSRFLEAEIHLVRLEDEDVETFSDFLAWLYTGELDFLPCCAPERTAEDLDELRGERAELVRSAWQADRSPSPEDLDRIDPLIRLPGSELTDEEWLLEEDQLVELYIFAERRGVRDLRDAVMDKLVCNAEVQFHMRREKVTSLRTVRKACESLPKTAKLLNFYTKEAAWLWGPESYKHPEMDSLPASFAFAVAALTASMRDKNNSEEGGSERAIRDRPLKIPWAKSVCRFHEHADKAARSRCAQENVDWQKAFSRLVDRSAGARAVRLV